MREAKQTQREVDQLKESHESVDRVVADRFELFRQMHGYPAS